MKRKGSMTCFSAMTIMLVGAFLLALLEAGRGLEMGKVAKMNSVSASESLFAGYAYPLWEDYHLLGVPTGSQEGGYPKVTRELYQFSKENLRAEEGYVTNLFAMQPTQVALEQCLLLTDQEGDAFVAATAAYMKENLLFEAGDSLVSYAGQAKELMESDYADPEAVEKAKEALSNMEEDVSSPKEMAEAAAANKKDTSFFEECEKTKGMGVLELVLPDTSQVSEKSIDLDQVVSRRELKKGNGSLWVDPGMEENLLCQVYLGKYLASFGDAGCGAVSRALSYEKEYVIAGKGSDVENLKAVIHRILAVREAGNLMFLASSPTKSGEAEAMALALAGATANPAIIEVVKWGIMASWAYYESILDARALLQGKRIPFIKDDNTWTSDLSALSQIAGGYMTAKEVTVGISYGEYLEVLMLMDGTKTLVYRAMDAMEMTVRAQPGFSSYRMDETMVCGAFSFSYEYPTIFLGMDALTKGKEGKRLLQNQVKYGYLGLGGS